MTFQGLKMDYLRQLTEQGFHVENKQRLNLSMRAYTILLNDIDVFKSGSGSTREQGELSSAIINHIFRCFRERAEASAALMLTNRRLEIEEVLAALQSDDAREKAIQLLLGNYEKKLVAHIARWSEKGYPFSFRLDKNSIEYLVSDEGQQERVFYDDNVGRYIKFVIEEYTEHPYIERERIYHKDVLDEIFLATANKAMLKLTLHSTNTTGGVPRNNLIYVKPIGIRQDSEQLYNYLVGVTASCKEGPWNMRAIRLTSIKDCKSLSQPAFMSKEEKKRIEDAIRKNGVQYLSANHVEKIVVQFTPEGKRLYQQILHLRPLFTANPKPLVYEFECTPFQAETYFFKYGHNVKILEPQYLATKFLRRYQSAAQIYRT